MYHKSILNCRKILFVLCLILALNIVGCANEKPDTVSETSSFADDLSTKVDAETESVSNRVEIETNAKKRIIDNKNILEVLKNKKKYFNTEFKEFRYLKDYSSINYMNSNGEGEYVYNENSGSADLKIDGWCEVDMDSDGNKEVILQTDYGNVLVLHSEDNIVYCYAFPFRGMKNIKTDGSFESSGSAANTYIGKLRFVDGECYYDEICAYDEVEKDNPIYRINKKHTNREEVKSFIKQQAKKEKVLVEKGYPISIKGDFWKDGNTFSVKIMYAMDGVETFLKSKGRAKIRKERDYNNGTIYHVIVNSDDGNIKNRSMAYFYVEDEKIYVISSYDDNSDEIESDNLQLVYQEKNIEKDNGKGLHYSITNKGNIVKFSLYTYLVETNYFHQMKWGKERNIKLYKTGYGAGRDLFQVRFMGKL